MLTKHLEKTSANQTRNRSARIIITNEARALRELRIMHGLSMRKAGALIGVSDSYISHIENGRTDFPKNSRLDKFLAVYGGIKQKSFFERVRNLREEVTPEQELAQLIPKLGKEKISILLNLAKNI